MKIRILGDLRIPSLSKGMVLDVQSVVQCRGKTVFFVHHAGNYLGIREVDCEIWEKSE